MSAARFEGTLKSWNDERGFGFIEPTQGGQEIFVHIKAFTVRPAHPQVNLRVTFEVEPGPQGKKRAKNVQPLHAARTSARQPRSTSAQWGTATLFAIPALIIVFVIVGVLWRPSLWVTALYVLASLLTFVVYAIDKSAAQNGRWRIPEVHLHFLAMVGGWPGALLAQQFLRHKSTKAAFRSVFWITVVFNMIAFVTLCSPVGRAFFATH